MDSAAHVPPHGSAIDPRRVSMVGTFGLRRKGTLRARAIGLGNTLQHRHWCMSLITVPWDSRQDAGTRWIEDGISVTNTRFCRPALAPLAVTELVRHVQRRDPSLIHLFKPKGFGDLAARLLRRTYPIVVDMDDWEGDGGWNDTGIYGPLQRRLFDWQERTWPQRASAITVASRELRRRAIELGAPEDRVIYVPNGLTRQRLTELGKAEERPERRVDLSEPGPRILLYTRFVEFDAKPLAFLLADLVSEIPEIRLIIAGASANGRPEQELQQAARELNVDRHIETLGWIEPRDLAMVASHCDLAIHPFDDTPINRAKSSVKLLELMATRTPVITSAVGENTTFIEDGRSGMLVSPGDLRILAPAIKTLLRQPERRREMGILGRRRVEAEFAWETLAPRVEAAYAIAVESG